MRSTLAELRHNDTVLIRNCPRVSARKAFMVEKVLKSPEREREELHARQAAEAAARQAPPAHDSEPSQAATA